MRTFFLIGGIVLVVSGSLQALVRPRVANETWAARLVNRATVRALVFLLAGTFAILAGTGVIAMPMPP